MLQRKNIQRNSAYSVVSGTENVRLTTDTGASKAMGHNAMIVAAQGHLHIRGAYTCAVGCGITVSGTYLVIENPAAKAFEKL